MSIERAYKSALERQKLTPDAGQLAVVQAMQKLQNQILQEDTFTGKLGRRFAARAALPATRGIYLWGGVGRGKTFLMDLFFDSLAIKKKKRIHFHRMMRDIHARLKQYNDIEDPLDRVAADIAEETTLLCFDEFFVNDIADAMILGRLLDSLFERNVTLVATSNSQPDDLYKHGLQRERFLPAISLLKEKTKVMELAGTTDYRLNLLQEAGTILTPADVTATAKLHHYFQEIASGEVQENYVLDVLGRSIKTLRCAKGVAWFDFNDICDGPRSQEDYIEISRWYPTVIVSDIPQLTSDFENPARRFIALVDEFYDRKVKLIASTAVHIESLYAGNRLGFEFQRTISRLTEMQSNEYLHAAHLS